MATQLSTRTRPFIFRLRCLPPLSTLAPLSSFFVIFKQNLVRHSASLDISIHFLEPAIYGYNHVVATANKMLKLAKVRACLFVIMI